MNGKVWSSVRSLVRPIGQIAFVMTVMVAAWVYSTLANQPGSAQPDSARLVSSALVQASMMDVGPPSQDLGTGLRQVQSEVRQAVQFGLIPDEPAAWKLMAYLDSAAEITIQKGPSHASALLQRSLAEASYLAPRSSKEGQVLLKWGTDYIERAV